MYLLYVDESGDPGLGEFSSLHYSLSGLVVKAEQWQIYLERLKGFREYLKSEYGLNKRTELHASELVRVGKTKALKLIPKSRRIEIMRICSLQIPIIFKDAKIINVYLQKKDFKSKDIQDQAWKRMIIGFENLISKSDAEKGLIISDEGIGIKVISVLRQMRENKTVENIIEDIFTHDSKDSYFIQCADLISYFLYRKEQPKGSLKKFGVEFYFNHLEPILYKSSNSFDQYGVIRK